MPPGGSRPLHQKQTSKYNYIEAVYDTKICVPLRRGAHSRPVIIPFEIVVADERAAIFLLPLNIAN